MVDLRKYADDIEAWQFREVWRHEAERLIEAVRLRTSESCLDIGAGAGRFVQLCHASDATAVGFDTNPYCIKKMKDAGLGHFDIWAPGHRPFFEVVTMSHVLGHVPDPGALLRRAHALTVPGARLGVIVPNATYDRLMLPFNRLVGYKDDPTLVRSLPFGALRALLEGSGPWRIERVYYDGEFVKYLPRMIQPQSWRSRLCVVARRGMDEGRKDPGG